MKQRNSVDLLKQKIVLLKTKDKNINVMKVFLKFSQGNLKTILQLKK